MVLWLSGFFVWCVMSLDLVIKILWAVSPCGTGPVIGKVYSYVGNDKWVAYCIRRATQIQILYGLIKWQSEKQCERSYENRESRITHCSLVRNSRYVTIKHIHRKRVVAVFKVPVCGIGGRDYLKLYAVLQIIHPRIQRPFSLKSMRI